MEYRCTKVYREEQDHEIVVYIYDLTKQNCIKVAVDATVDVIT